MENNIDYLAVCVNRLKQIRDSARNEFIVKMAYMAAASSMAEAYANYHIWKKLDVLLAEFERCDGNRRMDLSNLIISLKTTRGQIEDIGYNPKPDYFTELVKGKSKKETADLFAAMDMLDIILKGAIGLPNGIVWHGDDHSSETEER